MGNVDLFGRSAVTIGQADRVEVRKSLFLEVFAISGLIGPTLTIVNRKLPPPDHITYATVRKWRDEDEIFSQRVAYFEDQLKLELERTAVQLALGREADPEVEGDKGVEPDAAMLRFLLPRLYPEKYSINRQGKVAGDGGGNGQNFMPPLTRPAIIDVDPPTKEDAP